MNPPDERRFQEIEARLARLEARAPVPSPSLALPDRLHPAWALALSVGALGCGYFGLGLPQHYYQPLFALLFLLLGYHRGFFRPAPGAWRWPQVAANFLLLALLFKLLLGGGLQYPFDWLKVPAFIQSPEAGDGSWYKKLLPDYQLTWQGVPGVSDWYINMTKIQSLLLVATLAGALFRFQPFASFTALVLLLVSFPSYLGFHWDWVILFLVLGGAALYLQSGKS
jgi:hypothetical protein